MLSLEMTFNRFSGSLNFSALLAHETNHSPMQRCGSGYSQPISKWDRTLAGMWCKETLKTSSPWKVRGISPCQSEKEMMKWEASRQLSRKYPDWAGRQWGTREGSAHLGKAVEQSGEHQIGDPKTRISPTAQHRELCSVLHGSLDGRGVGGRMDTRICMAESLYCPPESLSQRC